MPMLSCPVQIPLVDRETNGNFLREKAKLSAFRRHKKDKKQYWYRKIWVHLVP